MTTQSNQKRLQALRTLIGARLRSLREYRDLSQPDLADKAGIGRSTVSLIETGERAPGADIIIQLVNALNTNADYLLGISDDPSPRPTLNSPALADPRIAEIVAILATFDDARKRSVLGVLEYMAAVKTRKDAERAAGGTTDGITKT